MDDIQPAGFGRSEDPSSSGVHDVGAFRQGSPASQWALGRYLVGRAVAEAMSNGLLILAVLLLGAAAAIWAAGSAFWGVVAGILAVAVVVMRRLVTAVLQRLPLSSSSDPSVEGRLRDMVRATRKDVLRELRRLRLPSRSWTLPLLAVRLVGRRRQETAERLRGFDVDRVVPAARLDELHLLLQVQPPHGAP